ncbi:MAG: type II toxin-antitoxin system VapC family toxin [Gammaproteobacteria bacterium]|nr:type II toxin-antitoxin system VapC family toxin [Gammaproteobacteria bacterium]
MYLLDTNILIYLLKQRPPSVLQKFETLEPSSVAMSVISLGELEYGAAKSQNSEQAFGVIQQLLLSVPALPMSADTATQYGDIRSQLTKQGNMIGNNDLWIAAHAKALGWILVSNNVREFERVEGLELENWV